MTTYTQLQQQNAQRTSALAVLLLRGVGTSTASAAQVAPATPAVLARALVAGATRSVLIADLGLAAWLTLRTRRPFAPVGLVLPKPTEAQITEAVDTIVEDFSEDDDLDNLTMRVDRLANAAPLDAGQDAYQEAAQAHGVEAWIRRTDPKPCDLCKSLADGKARPVSVRMYRHPGCSCVPEPVEIGEDFVGTLVTGHGIGGVETRFARPGLTFSRTTFVPARSA